MGMKRMLIFTLAICLVVGLFAACAQTEKPAESQQEETTSVAPTEEASVEETPVEGASIALLNASSGNAWRAQMEVEMNGLIDEYKASGIVSSYVAYSADDDAAKQSQQLSQIVSAGGTDIVIINPVSATSLNPVIDKAIEAGIIVLGVDSVISHPDVVTLATDQYQWAAIQAEHLATVLGGKGNIVVFNAIAGFPASDTREQAFNDVLAKYPDIKVLKQVYHNWDEGEAKQLTATLISAYPEIDAVLNQDCSPGIVQGFQEAGVTMPKCITSDGSITYLNMWNDYNTENPNSPLEAIIVGNPPGIGASAIKVALQMLNGEEFKDGVLQSVDGGMAILLTPAPVITNENLAEWVEKASTMDVSYTFSAILSDEEVSEMFK